MTRITSLLLVLASLSTATLAHADDSTPSDSPADAPPEPEPTAAPASIELALGVTPSASFGQDGFAGLILTTQVDFAIVLDPRVALVIGASFTSSESEGSEDFDDGASLMLRVPLLVQIYFDDPTVGAVLPTLRAGVVGWFADYGDYGRSFGGAVQATGGATWIAAPWAALRLEMGGDLWFGRSENDVTSQALGLNLLARGSVAIRL